MTSKRWIRDQPLKIFQAKICKPKVNAEDFTEQRSQLFDIKPKTNQILQVLAKR